MNALNGPAAARPRRHGATRYELRSLLGAGGMGAIYLGYDRLAQREVAYKRLTVDDEAQRALRTTLFQREYDSLVQLPHPNIIEVFDYGEDASGPYYAMELLGGADLSALAPLPPREACRVLRDIASALALVHARRLLHRDVSPNNVRLTAEGKAKLLDFGALAPFGRPVELVGTAAFIAPECLSDAVLDQRSDLFSLGALAYWALTRHTSVAARSISELIDTTYELPPPPSVYVDAIPRELDELVLALLAPDPGARPASAAYVIDRLTTIADLPPELDERRVAQSYLAHPPLCGRESALATLQGAVDAARAGSGRAVLVEAEAGVGRSALLASAALYGQLRGAFVLRARGDAAGASFRLVRTLVEQTFALYPDIEETSRTPSSIHTYYPNMREAAPDARVLAQRHAGVIASAQETLREVASRGPLVLVVDDVHLADSESIATLASLALTVAEHPITILMSGLVDRAEQDASAYAKLAATAVRVQIAPLAQAQVGELVQALFGGVPNSLPLAQWLHRESGGNPTTLLDLTHLLLQRDLIRYTLGTFVLPHEADIEVELDVLRQAVLARLGDLSPTVSLIACALSLHDRTLTSTQLAAIAQLPLRDVLRAVEELTKRGIAETVDDGVMLLGASLRAALKGSLSPERARALHLSIARALLAYPSDTPDLRFEASTHLLAAGEEDEGLALIENLAHRTLIGPVVARWAPLLELAIPIAIAKKRSKETRLSLLMPLAANGFSGSMAAQERSVESALRWSADVCGMTLSTRLGRFIGSKLALLVGLLYAATRRALTPARERLGTLGFMLAYFVGMVADAVAVAAIRGDAVACRRYVARLEPLRALPKATPGGIMRAFCQATSELAAGQTDRAAVSYDRMLSLVDKPIKGLEMSQQTLRLGALNGSGLCEASNGNARALMLAEGLDGDAFFSPHAEVIRLMYHGTRGDRDAAELHRERAERLALSNGTSWSAALALMVNTAYAATLTEDAIALVQVIAQFDRFARIAPKHQAYRAICAAWLEHVRGRSEAARTLFEAVIDSPDSHGHMTVALNHALFANVLNHLGDHEHALTVCTRMAESPEHRGEHNLAMRTLERERAVAEAGLGQLAPAIARWEAQLTRALPLDNPLELGASHRDRARIALLASDQPAFDAHLAEMERHFRATRNPCLIAQCDGLVAKAVRAGLRVERHALPRAEPEGAEALSDMATYIEAPPSRQNG